MLQETGFDTQVGVFESTIYNIVLVSRVFAIVNKYMDLQLVLEISQDVK